MPCFGVSAGARNSGPQRPGFRRPVVHLRLGFVYIRAPDPLDSLANLGLGEPSG